MIALDHSYTGERFREPAGNFSVDFPALAEDRPDFLERSAQPNSEPGDEHQRQHSNQRAEPQEIDERKQRREQASYEFHQARTDQISNTLHIAHDAGYQRA